MTRTIFLAGLYHETHTFLKQKTGLEQFRQDVVNIGEEIIDRNRDNGSPTDGFLSYATEQNWSIIPSIQMAAMPSGTVTDEAMNFFATHLFDKLEQVCTEIDAIYLVLHGAMVSESYDDVEGEILSQIRDFLSARGIDIPVVAVIDLHANVSSKMTDNSSCIYSYRKNPHSDAREAAVHTAFLLDQLLSNPSATQVHLGTKYVIPPTGLGTVNDPMKSVLARAIEIEKADADLLCINVMGGYAYADIADCGFSLNCCTRGDVAHAKAYLEELLAIMEGHLDAAYPLEATLEETLIAIDKASHGSGPILLIEPADNIGGGTPGDGTGILSPLLETGRENIVAIIADPEAAAHCHAMAVGDEVSLMIGGKVDDRHGDPVSFTGTIAHLSDGMFDLENKQSHMASMMGTRINMGLCAVLKNGQATVLLTSRKTPPMDLGQLHSQMVRPEDADLVIIKAAVSHKDAYDAIAAASYYVDSTGLCTSNLASLPYQKLTGKQISLA